MQSWGTGGYATQTRDTNLEPSKSGILGVLSAALGRPRSTPLGDLANLRMGVRIDRAGTHAMDLQTIHDAYRANGGTKPSDISYRYYLADASFLVGLESADLALLEQVQAALHAPVWPLFLGRKSYIPGSSIYLPDGLVDTALLPALLAYPNPARIDTARYLLFDDPSGTELRYDAPTPTTDFVQRAYGTRTVTRISIMAEVPDVSESAVVEP